MVTGKATMMSILSTCPGRSHGIFQSILKGVIKVGGDRFDTHIWLTFSYYIKEFLTSDTDAGFPIPLIP
jgi:hypothetical protein